MRIAIDARFLGPEGAGLGKYTEKLLEHLQKIDKKNRYFILLRKSNFSLFKQTSPNFEKILADAKWYTAKEQVLLPRILNKLGADFTHFLHYNVPLFWKGRFVVTIYDLTKLEFGKQASNISNPAIFYPKQLLHNVILNSAVRKASKIISGSDTTKKKITERFGIEDSKITTIYAGADEIFFKEPQVQSEAGEKVLHKYGIKKPYILYVGNAFPYKNVELILESLKYLKRGVSFVYVSSRSTSTQRLVEKAKNLKVDNRFLITGFVPNSDLALLYRKAAGYVFPSLSEGFGLPGLEAMAAGCPVLASNIEVLKEIYGDAAVYFNPRDARELAKKIELITHNQGLRIDLIAKGHKQVEKYSWEDTAKKTLEIYKEMLELTG